MGRVQMNTNVQPFGINNKILSGHKEGFKKRWIQSQSVGVIGKFKENLDLKI